MTDEEAAAKGYRAEREYAETEEAFEAVRKAILDELVGTTITHTDKILKLHAAAQNLDAVKKALMDVVQNGQIARVALAQTGLTRP
jgi:hypothetical protein